MISSKVYTATYLELLLRYIHTCIHGQQITVRNKKTAQISLSAELRLAKVHTFQIGKRTQTSDNSHRFKAGIHFKPDALRETINVTHRRSSHGHRLRVGWEESRVDVWGRSCHRRTHGWTDIHRRVHARRHRAGLRR